MAGVLTLRSGNPALTARTFEKYHGAVGVDQMTLSGTVNKTAGALGILIITAAIVWTRGIENQTLVAWLAGCTGLAFVLIIATTFKHTWAQYTTPLFAISEGVVLGGVSLLAEARYPGIVGQAVFLTFGTLASLLVAYRSGMIRPTENFKLGIAAATGAVFLFYLGSFVLGLLGIDVPLPWSNGLVGILFSVFVVILAALNLVLDFDFIENGVNTGAPKYMEWYAAFGLLVTLVWLYFEILRLLMKLQSRRR